MTSGRLPVSAHEGQGLVMWRQASQGQRVSPAHGGRLPWVGTFDAVGGHFCAAGDLRRRRGPGSCPRARRVSPLRSGVHPAAWNVPGRSGSVGSGGVSTVDGVVELLRRSLSVQDDAGSAVEAVLDGLDLGVGDGGEAGALGEVFADQAVGVLGRVKRWRRHSWERVVCLRLVVAGVCILMWRPVSRICLSLRRRCVGCLLLLD